MNVQYYENLNMFLLSTKAGDKGLKRDEIAL